MKAVNQICVVQLRDLDVFDLLVFDLEEDNARKFCLVSDAQGRNKLLIEPFDNGARTRVKIEDAKFSSRQAIQLRKGTLILEDATESGVSEVVEDEREGSRSPFCEMLFADCIEPTAEGIEVMADSASVTLLVNWDHVVVAERAIYTLRGVYIVS